MMLFVDRAAIGPVAPVEEEDADCAGGGPLLICPSVVSMILMSTCRFRSAPSVVVTIADSAAPSFLQWMFCTRDTLVLVRVRARIVA